MEDVVQRLENIANKLTGDNGYVYILEEGDCYDGWSKVIGCYSTPEKVYDAACKIIDWMSISLEDMHHLIINTPLESDDVSNRYVRITKLTIQ